MSGEGQGNAPEDNDMAMDDKPVKKRGLGRGLDALFGDDEGDYEASGHVAQSSSSLVEVVGIEQVEPNVSQPRKTFHDESLDDLAESVKQYGILQPILVRRKPSNPSQYQIIAGERRWRAAQQAQIHDIPVVVMDKGDEQTLEIALVENLQRENLNPLDEAEGYKSLVDQYGYSHDQIAKAVGKSRPYVANIVRLLGLSPKVRHYVRDGKLTVGHARALLNTPNAGDLAEKIIAEDLSVRAVESLVSGDKDSNHEANTKQSSTSAKKKKSKDADTLALEEDISGLIGMPVSIDVGSDGQSGVVKIHYDTLDSLDLFLKRLTGISAM